MATHVLIAGNWLGGWAWADVTTRLRAAGHDVHPVTLTGLGDRAHLASPQVNLDTHIADVVHTITYADLHDVILVGHSYGGFPVTGAADRIPERVSRVVYVESGPLPDGTSQLDMLGPDARDAVLTRMKEREDGWLESVPTLEDLTATGDGSANGLGPAEWARFTAHAVPQPLGANAQPLRLTNDIRRDAIPHTLVTCMFPLEQVKAMVAAGHPFFAGFGGKEWTYAELPTGHWPMFSEPAGLAAILDELASRPAGGVGGSA
ncbi:alpha/beta fold hydrolase [Actinopolymorpha alba]|uniref:alpha/beta fold hydrolase n=1 Tax=Actinopolymorpha alba TaxID=533267 RepID=UPI00037F0EB2|nr:alpha/beta hydrolase [Actinopolymorpha alba]